MRIGFGFTMTEVLMDIVIFSERGLQSLLHQRKITNSNTENNKADANKCVCLICWKGECEMITRNYFGKLEPRKCMHKIV